MTEMVPNEEKVKELILLLSEMSEGDEYFGATKLNKLLFFADFLSYILHGKPISGYVYQARPEGPMLKDFYQIRDEMKQSRCSNCVPKFRGVSTAQNSCFEECKC